MLMQKHSLKKNKKKKGMAVIEAIPALFMLVVVFNFSMGFFGAIHSGILNSIGAYNYTYETFRYRSNLMYFRPGGSDTNYKLSLNRVHGIMQDGSVLDPDEDKSLWPATIRDITLSPVSRSPALSSVQASDREYAGRNNDNNLWFATSEYEPRSGSSIQTPRIWVKTIYGICINADCTTDGESDRTGE